MAQTVYNDITDWRISPLNKIELFINSNSYVYENIIKDGSTFEISPVMSIGSDANGWNRIVALNFSGTFKIIQNNLEDQSPVLDEIISHGLEKIKLTMEPIAGQLASGQIVIEIDTVNAAYHSWQGTFKTVSGENGLVLIFETNGRFSTDVLTTSTKLFTQNW